MTIFANVATHDNVRPSLGNTSPGLGEYLGAAAGDAWEDSPLSSLSRMREMNEALYGEVDATDPGGVSPDINYTPPTSPLSMEEQKQHIADAGLEGRLQPQEGYTQEALDIITARKKAELGRKEVREAAPNSWGPLGVAAGLGTALLDPINVASAFFPVVGGARALRLLQGAAGAWGRAGVRAGIGAVEGGVGAAVMEPLVYAAKTQEQADYGMVESLLNVGFGAAFGAVLHPAAGGVGEALRAWRGERQPWEIQSPTNATESLRAALADDMRDALAMSGVKGADARDVARASAALFDARARTWAFDMGRGAEEYYARYRPGFAAESGPEALKQAAMKRSHAQDIESFIAESRTGGKSYMLGARYPTALQEHFKIDDLVVNFPYSYVRHLDSQRPMQAEALIRDTERVLAEADVVARTGTARTGEPLYSAVKYDGNRATLVIFAVSASKKKGNRAIPRTAYTNTAHAIDALIEQKNRVAPSAGSAPSLPKPSREGELREYATLSKEILEHHSSNVNGSGVPRAAVNFDADGKALMSFFASADPTSAPHELYHIFRREMAQTAADAAAPPHVREDWRKVLDFVGAEEGQAWTRDMEERFARAGERFLLEGVAPAPSLQGVFARLRQWFLEVYGNADAAGLAISKEMREVFSSMLSMPMESADKAFRYALGDLLSRDASEGLDAAFESPGMTALPRDEVERLTDESVVRLRETLDGVRQAHPDAAEAVGAVYQSHMDEADAGIAMAAQKREVLRQAALCETRR